MKESHLEKAEDYFKQEYGDRFINRGCLFDFGFSNLPRLIQYSNLSSDAKLCYIALIDFHFNSDEPRPWTYYSSQKRIAFVTGLNRQTANKAFRELGKRGLIGTKRQGQGKLNIYCILRPPKEFAQNAIRKRAALQLITEGKMTWEDVSDNGKINSENLQTLITTRSNSGDNELTLSTSTPEGQNANTHLEVNHENGNQPNDDTENSPNSQIHLEVNCENAPPAIPPQDERSLSQTQELTSVELTSEDIKDSSISSEVVSSKVNSLKKKEEETNCFEHKNKNLDKYKGWGFASLFTLFKSMLKKEEVPHQLVTGIIFDMLDRLGVRVKDKNGKATFAMAGKVKQLGNKGSADLLWKMWTMKCDGVLASPDGYLYKVMSSMQGDK